MPSSLRAIVIGASAGAVEALLTLLPGLPADYKLPIMIVVHIPPRRESLIAELMRSRCRVPVREAEDKEILEPGTVYFAPPDYHLLVEADGRLSLSIEEAVHFSRPSIDVLFESAADAYGTGLLGVVLSGANSDGARGLAAIAREGGVTVVQRPQEAQAAAMPEAAIAACPNAMVMSLREIASFLEKAA